MKDAFEASAQILWHYPIIVFIFLFYFLFMKAATEGSAQISCYCPINVLI